jgi:hypothetical protein
MADNDATYSALLSFGIKIILCKLIQQPNFECHDGLDITEKLEHNGI